MTRTTETYSCACPRCGYPETRDSGPYDPHPFDAALGTPDPAIHLMWCGRCGKPFDAGPADVPCPRCGDRGHRDPHSACGSDGCNCDVLNRA